MSYVLDALRRADAERQQGRPPDLNAPGALRAGAAPAQRVAPAARLARGWPGWALLLVASLAAGLLLLWAPGERLDPPPGSVPLGTEAPAVAPRAAAPAPRPFPAPSPGLGAAPVPPRPVLAPAPAVAPAPRAAMPTAATAALAAPSAPGAGAALPIERLDPALRQSLPPLAFSGAMDSPDPAARMLIVNGRLLREGDSVASDLVLERIALRSAVLRWRGQRIEVRY